MKTILHKNLGVFQTEFFVLPALSSPPFLCTSFPLSLNNCVCLPLSTGPHYSYDQGGLTSCVPSPTSLPDANESGTRV